MSETSIQHGDAHEPRDVSLRRALLFALIFAAGIVASALVLWLVFGTREGGFAAAEHLGKASDNSELQQRDQLARYRASQTAELQRLAWTDPTHQAAKVPIEEAMAILAAKGAAR
jgi:hypothetical protein